ncbi:MAG: hypothetical protein ABI629_10995 [bacterium]
MNLEGPRLEVTRLQNQLRKLSYDELSRRPNFSSTVRTFRGQPVCIAIAKAETEQGQVVVLLRGFVPNGRGLFEVGFAKRSDETWLDLSLEERDLLRTVIDDESPKGIAP